MPPDTTKTVVRQVRFAPAEWRRVRAKADELGIPAARLIQLATMRLLGERTDLDRVEAVAGALSGMRPLSR